MAMFVGCYKWMKAWNACIPKAICILRTFHFVGKQTLLFVSLGKSQGVTVTDDAGHIDDFDDDEYYGWERRGENLWKFYVQDESVKGKGLMLMRFMMSIAKNFLEESKLFLDDVVAREFPG